MAVSISSKKALRIGIGLDRRLRDWVSGLGLRWAVWYCASCWFRTLQSKRTCTSWLSVSALGGRCRSSFMKLFWGRRGGGRRRELGSSCPRNPRLAALWVPMHAATVGSSLPGRPAHSRVDAADEVLGLIAVHDLKEAAERQRRRRRAVVHAASACLRCETLLVLLCASAALLPLRLAALFGCLANLLVSTSARPMEALEAAAGRGRERSRCARAQIALVCALYNVR
jgi:hypothetical protein